MYMSHHLSQRLQYICFASHLNGFQLKPLMINISDARSASSYQPSTSGYKLCCEHLQRGDVEQLATYTKVRCVFLARKSTLCIQLPLLKLNILELISQHSVYHLHILCLFYRSNPCRVPISIYLFRQSSASV
jgi:hypothetical protein